MKLLKRSSLNWIRLKKSSTLVFFIYEEVFGGLVLPLPPSSALFLVVLWCFGWCSIANSTPSTTFCSGTSAVIHQFLPKKHFFAFFITKTIREIFIEIWTEEEKTSYRFCFVEKYKKKYKYHCISRRKSQRNNQG